MPPVSAEELAASAAVGGLGRQQTADLLAAAAALQSLEAQALALARDGGGGQGGGGKVRVRVRVRAQTLTLTLTLTLTKGGFFGLSVAALSARARQGDLSDVAAALERHLPSLTLALTLALARYVAIS